jgi:hypothetical protein
VPLTRAHVPGVAKELEYIKATWHLIPSLKPTLMWASEGSPMGFDQDRYAIKIQHGDPHPLLKLLFGVAMPWGSYSAYDLDFGEDGDLTRAHSSYFDMMRTLTTVYLSRPSAAVAAPALAKALGLEVERVAPARRRRATQPEPVPVADAKRHERASAGEGRSPRP